MVVLLGSDAIKKLADFLTHDFDGCLVRCLSV